MDPPSASSSSPPSEPFSLSADPDTDIWKKPPSHDVFTAPFRVHSAGPLEAFVSASVTFAAPYRLQYDQAGLLLLLTRAGRPRRWIKAGVELLDAEPRLSCVCCDHWADWGVAPAPAAAAAAAAPISLRVEARRDAAGRSLWIYRVDPAGGRQEPLREVCWPYGEDGWRLEVAAVVARPAKEVAAGRLEARFEHLHVEWRHDGS